MQNHVIGRNSGDFHQDWGKDVLSHRMTLIEGLELAHVERKINRLNIRRVKKRKTKSKSRNTRLSTNKM